jgi:phosphohistidine phosphatase
MRLYVMRHGPAEDRAPSGRDFDRALTRAGREVVARAARSLHEHPLPARVIASPYLRAHQTAEIVASTASLEIEVHEDLAADAGLPLALVRDLAAAESSALLVGHQPIVEELVRALVHPGRVPLPTGFRTAMIVALDQAADRPRAVRDDRADEQRWVVSTVLDPHQAGT